VAILSPQARQRLEPLLDCVQTAGLDLDTVAQTPQDADRLLDLNPRVVDRLSWRSERGIEAREIVQDPGRACQALDCRLRRVVEQRHRFGQPGREALRVLESP